MTQEVKPVGGKFSFSEICLAAIAIALWVIFLWGIDVL